MESKSGFLRPDTPLPVNSNGKQKSPSANELLVASRKGHTSEVKKILAEGGGSGSTNLDKHGRNCLHLACHYGRLETVQAILSFENIIDINSVSKRGFTPLHEASGEGHLSVVFLLLAKEAFLRARSKEGWTALMSASYNGHNDVARVLIAAGLDVNATNTNGFTALHVAAWRGHTKIIEMLLKEGALITLETTSKKNALDIAREEKQFEVITILQAASTKDSEKPFYRIASLEAQLKVAQEKLVQTQEKHEKILKAEREEMAKHYDDMKKKLLQELVINGSDSSHSGSENEIGNDAFAQSSDIPIIITSIESPNTATSKKSKPVISVLKEKRDQVPTMASPLVNRRAYKPSVPKLQPRMKNDTKVLDSLCLDPIQEYNSTDDGIKTRRSLDGLTTAMPKLNGDKLTITQLVENSKQGPSTIASIRKQLKEDGLTPKIKKKFEKQELPAVSHHSEKPYAPLEGQTRMQTEQ